MRVDLQEPPSIAWDRPILILAILSLLPNAFAYLASTYCLLSADSKIVRVSSTKSKLAKNLCLETKTVKSSWTNISS